MPKQCYRAIGVFSVDTRGGDMESIRMGQVIAGRYRLEAPLAQGGMGSVWRARHLQLDTLLAVKFINLAQRASANGRVRFEREAKAAALLHGPNVVEVYDYGIDEGLPYLVMELLKGEDLSRRLVRDGRLPIPSLVSLVGQVSRALRRAHEAGIVHRDLKPGNVFLVEREDDEEPLVKVLDFGIARAPHLGLVGETTKTGAILGSPRYMSPEQARSPRSVDPRSDLWSLAVIAFRALTGSVPFMADEVGELLFKICTETAPAPSSIQADLGTDFDHFFARAFARDPQDRFQTARELAMELATCAGTSPMSSRSAASSTGAWAAQSTRAVSAPDHGVAEVVAIAPIAPIASVAPEEPRAGECKEVTRLSLTPLASSRPTVPEGRLRGYARAEGTLTQAPRSLDVAHRVKPSRLSARRRWASAALLALAGLMSGAAVALGLFSPPAAPTAAASRPPLADPAPSPGASVVTLEAALSASPATLAPSTASSNLKPAASMPQSGPLAPAPARFPGRRGFKLGI